MYVRACAPQILCMYVCVRVCLDGLTDGLIDGWLGAWPDGKMVWMHGWVVGGWSEWVGLNVCNVCMYACNVM